MPWIQSNSTALIKYVFNLGSFTPPGTYYLGLSSTTANPALGTWTELTQANYARQPITWAYGGDTYVQNSTQIDFVNLGGGLIYGQGIWNTATGGSLLYWNDFLTSYTAITGDTLSYKPGYIKVSF